MTTEEKLDKLAELHAKADLLRIEYEDKRTEIMAPVADKLTALDAEYEPKLANVQDEADQLEAEIRAEVLEVGETVKGTRLIAVWNKGRDSLDTKGLKGYAVAHPEIAAFWKPGQPTVSLRMR